MALAKSHIIPKSLYGDGLSQSEGPAQIITDKPGQHPRRTRTGIYDKDIVCHACEARFNPWDNYAYKLLMNTEADDTLSRGNEIGGYVYNEVDYRLLKLFFLSLLWRAHHSRHSLFEGVDVGRKMERQLRELILAGHPGCADDFTVVLARFDDELANGFLHPFHERYDGVGFYRLFFAMHVAYIKVTTRSCPVGFKHFCLAPDRPLFLVAREFRGSKEMQAMLGVLSYMDSQQSR